MCGIAGIYHTDTHSATAIQNMLDAMQHRGPDDRGVFAASPVFLGHNRLSIIDLSAAGHQPMTSLCGRYTMVLNGEVYNFNELRKQLSGFSFRSHTDTEVVLELWAKMEDQCLPLLRGMFAFAVWDKQDNTIAMARDHMGIKPVYYWHRSGQLVFASEMKGMLASGFVEKKIDPEALTQYLYSGYVMQPRTMISGVSMLPPASWLKFDGKHITVKQYWDFKDPLSQTAKTEADAIRCTKELIEDSVAEETISDRPLGVFLSGGLDSTVLVAALRNKGVKDIRTFSVGFEGDELSEEEDVREAVNFYHTDHTQLQVTDKDIVPHIERYINAIDQPSVDGLNTWLVSKVTVDHVTVALSGLGGDELFSGYSIDRKILARKKYLIPASILSATRWIWSSILPKKIASRLSVYATWTDPATSYAQWGALLDSADVRTLTRSGKTSGDNREAFRSVDPRSGYTWLQRIGAMHLRGFMMSRLLRDSDAVSMDHSLEVRFPVIDHRLVSYAWSWADNWKIKFLSETAALGNFEKESSYERNGVKHLLYQAFKNDLPPGFGTRPKRGFKMPIGKWMKGGLNKDIETTLTAADTFLDSKALKQKHREWMAGNGNWAAIWALYVFEKWVRKNGISA